MGEGTGRETSAPEASSPVAHTPSTRLGDYVGHNLLGRAIGPFRIESHLGSGGMGAVYGATDERLNRRVAVKLLPRGGEEDALRLELLLREARAAATINHPNAVKIFDVGELDGTPYLVMELVIGKTLRTFARDPSVPVEHKIGWMIDVAQALSAAHAKRVIHQDIKPDNVMLGDDGVIKVLDFGLARRVVEPNSANAGVESSWGFHGTAAYMAPERMRGAKGDALSDQFAWGVFAYELLAGQLPWSMRGGMAQLVNDVLTQTPDPIRRHCPDVPKAIDRVVLRAMAKRPKDRFPSMDGVVAALTGRGSGALGVGADDHPAWRRRRFAAMASVALALVGVAWWNIGRRNAPAIAPSAVASVAPPPASAAPPDYGSVMSPNPEAAEMYREGVRLMRDASGSSARRHLERAIALDPSFAAAHLRKILATPTASDAEQASLLKATELRNTLSEHDRGLLLAIGPWVTIPQDAREVERRLVELTAGHSDPDYLYQLCRFRVLGGNYAGAVDACKAARERDADSAAPVWLEGLSRLLLGQTGEGQGVLDACLDLSPRATSCLNDLLQLTLRQGECGAALGYAERLVAVDPDTPLWLEELGGATYAMNRPMAEVRAAIERRWDGLNDDVGLIGRAAARVRLAVLAGDFDEAARQLDVWERSAATQNDELSQVELFQVQAQLQREVGQEAGFVPRARSFLASRAAWSPSPDGDASIEAWIALYRGGAISREEFVAARADWLSRERRGPPRAVRFGNSPGWPWISAYAKSAVTREDAKEAVAALPEYQPLPADRVRSASDDEPTGATFVLAGDAEGALPFLRRAARSCGAIFSPFHHTWANLELARLLEPRDTAGACAAYKVVIDRWGTAPQSRSGRYARSRWKQLHCP